MNIEKELDELEMHIINSDHEEWADSKRRIISAFDRQKWVSVLERLPMGKEIGVFPYGGVLVCTKQGIMALTHTYNPNSKEWYAYGTFAPTPNVTHWMPLPLAPEQGDNGDDINNTPMSVITLKSTNRTAIK